MPSMRPAPSRPRKVRRRGSEPRWVREWKVRMARKSWFSTWEGTEIKIQKGAADLLIYRDGTQNIMLADPITGSPNIIFWVPSRYIGKSAAPFCILISVPSQAGREPGFTSHSHFPLPYPPRLTSAPSHLSGSGRSRPHGWHGRMMSSRRRA